MVAVVEAAKRKIASTLNEWKLVLLRVRKPERDEFIQTAKVVGLGIIIVGSIAYIIHLIAVILMGGV